MSTNGHETLGRGIDIDQGVFGPGLGTFFIPITAPKVDHRPAVDYDGDCGANLALFIEIVRNRVTNPGKPGIAISSILERIHGSLMFNGQPLISV